MTRDRGRLICEVVEDISVCLLNVCVLTIGYCCWMLILNAVASRINRASNSLAGSSEYWP